MTGGDLAVVLATVVGSAFAAIRWLRVAQREHYLAPSVSRFATRWWQATPAALAIAGVAIGAAFFSIWWVPAGLIVAAAVAFGPPGLTLKGTTSPLAWTSRLRRVAALTGLLVVLFGVAGVWMHPAVAVWGLVLLPLLVDSSLWALAPWERRMGSRWVEEASKALDQSGATVVAITGSYGKTSTKGYVAQLLSGSKRVLASPASFNNRMGLARAINEHMSSGIEVFVAEMGTYGPGEIADLCRWIPPDIAVITAIGPVHLERFGTEERIVEAKSEILADARHAVLNVSDPRLAAVANAESSVRRVTAAGTDPGLDVSVVGGRVLIAGAEVGVIPSTAHPTNVACALGVVLALGVDPADVAGRLSTLTEPDHRLTTSSGASGVTIIDDTFNSNPAGAEAALSALASVPVDGRRVVVTPGMVELGPLQFEENRKFASNAGHVADQVLIIGRTNRDALVAGAAGGTAEVLVMDDRAGAVEWVRANLGPDDAVLYENDLPDHYP